MEISDEPPNEIQITKEFNYFVRSANYPGRCLGWVLTGERELQTSAADNSDSSSFHISRWDGVGVGTGTDG